MNALRAEAERWMRPRLSRAQLVHFLDEDRERVAEERDCVRPTEREALRGADRPESRPAAHDGTAASRRQSVRTKLRIILSDYIGGLDWEQ
jgi:hypothetical protein